jgi:hypothetical protein
MQPVTHCKPRGDGILVATKLSMQLVPKYKGLHAVAYVQQDAVLGMHAVLGLVKQHRGRPFNDRVLTFDTSLGGQAVHEDAPRPCLLHHLVINLRRNHLAVDLLTSKSALSTPYIKQTAS